MVECLTRDRGVAGSSLIGGTALCPGARHVILCLVLVQPRKTHPNMTKSVDWDERIETNYDVVLSLRIVCTLV